MIFSIKDFTYTTRDGRVYTAEQIEDFEASWSYPKNARTFNPLIPVPIKRIKDGHRSS